MNTIPNPQWRRRQWIGSLLALAAGLAAAPGSRAAPPRERVAVWKYAGCGCCEGWISHLQAAGFAVQATDVPDTSVIRSRLKLPERLGSCHTAQVAGYVVEGHVPAREIQRLLRERPAAIGLAVPGMPVGSPGMEVGKRRDAYQVLLVMPDGSTCVYQDYPAQQG